MLFKKELVKAKGNELLIIWRHISSFWSLRLHYMSCYKAMDLICPEDLCIIVIRHLGLLNLEMWLNQTEVSKIQTGFEDKKFTYLTNILLACRNDVLSIMD
jgi:hypothetical protein